MPIPAGLGRSSTSISYQGQSSGSGLQDMNCESIAVEMYLPGNLLRIRFNHSTQQTKRHEIRIMTYICEGRRLVYQYILKQRFEVEACLNQV